MVHEHAERAVGLPVHAPAARHRLADRAVDAVLQELLGTIGPHGPECRGARLRTSPLGNHPSTSSRTRRAYSSGVASQGSTRARASAPSRSASARSERTRTSASASASRVTGRDENAGLAVRDDVRDPADPAPDDGATARGGLDHDAAHALRARGQHQQRRGVERGGHLLGAQRRRPLDPPGQLGDELRRHGRQRRPGRRRGARRRAPRPATRRQASARTSNAL